MEVKRKVEADTQSSTPDGSVVNRSFKDGTIKIKKKSKKGGEEVLHNDYQPNLSSPVPNLICSQYDFHAPSLPLWGGFLGLAFLLCTFLYIMLNSTYLKTVALCELLAIVGFSATGFLIPSFRARFQSKGICGRDLNKLYSGHATQNIDEHFELRETHQDPLQIPEALGLVPGVIFLLLGICGQVFVSGDQVKGFADDVLDLPWRYKMALPCFASFPLLLAYRGSTDILVPGFLSQTLGLSNTVPLGPMYFIYMGMLAVFCTNSINIYAGINGLEVGQSAVMAGYIIAHNLKEISDAEIALHLPTISALQKLFFQTQAQQHMFSLMLSIPFLACSVALLCFNWYPSKVFVGDTYTYFAGMYFAVVGIFGHFSKTVLLFFIPQVINFLMSVPQLFGFVACPRHRVPRISPVTSKLEPSPNQTLINFVLRVCGPMGEQKLVLYLVALQVFFCTLGWYVRYSSMYEFFL